MMSPPDATQDAVGAKRNSSDDASGADGSTATGATTTATASASPSGDAYLESSKRRRTTASTSTSSRGVANLTPDQLAKKRANDREAQRAIRLRTKNQIEKLQNTIAELTSQQPYQELQNALRQKEIVEAENAEIKKRLASVLALINPILSSQGGCLNFTALYSWRYRGAGK